MKSAALVTLGFFVFVAVMFWMWLKYQQSKRELEAAYKQIDIAIKELKAIEESINNKKGVKNETQDKRDFSNNRFS